MDNLVDNSIMEPFNEDYDEYVKETSAPLRTLYQLLVDLYDNAYPIPFIDFRKVFERYMKATKKNIIDSIVLLIYGAKDIKHIGTGTETISVDRLVSGRERYSEDVKEVHSPFYRFIDMDDEVRIGYDYATVIDFVDHSSTQSTETGDVSSLIEADETIKTRVIPRFSMYINPDTGDITFVYKERLVELNIAKKTFIVKCKQNQYPLENVIDIEIQPVPKDCTAVKSVVINDTRIIVTVLDNGTQFCFNAEHGRFEIITEGGDCQYEYISG